MSITFDSPTSAGGVVSPSDVEGHVLVVEPVEYVAEMTTAYGTTDAIRVTVHDITEQTTTEEVLWFSGVLVSSLKSKIGKKVLGVMGKGQAKPGQSAPWVLVDVSGEKDAVDAATAYLTGKVEAEIADGSANPALNAALGNLKKGGLVK